MASKIQTHSDLEVYQKAIAAAMTVFQMSKQFPREETYSLTDQIRRSSRSVCANLAEAWRKRCYRASFIAKLIDAEAEAAETQVWLEFAAKCHYTNPEQTSALSQTYHSILGTLVGMRTHANAWIIDDPGGLPSTGMG
jgi:four helix bundle protein